MMELREHMEIKELAESLLPVVHQISYEKVSDFDRVEQDQLMENLEIILTYTNILMESSEITENSDFAGSIGIINNFIDDIYTVTLNQILDNEDIFESWVEKFKNLLTSILYIANASINENSEPAAVEVEDVYNARHVTVEDIIESAVSSAISEVEPLNTIDEIADANHSVATMLESDISERDNLIAQLTEDLAIAKETIQERDKQIKSILETTDHLNKDIADFVEEREKFQGVVSYKDKELAELRQLNAATEKENVILSSELDKAKKSIESIEELLSQTEIKLSREMERSNDIPHVNEEIVTKLQSEIKALEHLKSIDPLFVIINPLKEVFDDLSNDSQDFKNKLNTIMEYNIIKTDDVAFLEEVTEALLNLHKDEVTTDNNTGEKESKGIISKIRNFFKI